MGPCLTLIYVLTQPVPLQLISLWTFTGVTSWAVNTLVLTHVAGQAAFVDVLAGDHVLCQLEAVVALAEEGANQVVAVMLTGTLHITFIHINTAVVVAGQLVTCVALAVVGALGVHTSVHAVVGQGALVSVDTVVSTPLVSWRTLACVGSSGIDARLLRPAGVLACRAFIYVSAEVLVICSVSWCTASGPRRDPLRTWYHPRELRLAGWDGRGRRDRVGQWHLLAFLTNVDDSVLG